MALKKLNENPKTTDSILIEVETKDAQGCLIEPYRLDSVVVYYAERNFFQDSHGEYTHNVNNQQLIKEVQTAQQKYCDVPTDANLAALNQKRQELESRAVSSTFYFQDRKPVLIKGSPTEPAWFDSFEDSSFSKSYDEDGNEVVGQFEFTWEPHGSIREGQYFCCWTWTPLSSGEKLYNHISFSISGDTRGVTTIPTHRTVEDKYQILLERYLPELYKSRLCEGDITPETTEKLNNAVADGFTVVEDYANQVIDLLDANVLHESLLVYLSNLFNLKLKSSDPTLWRRQIKEAMPLFKKKGTRKGLEEAFSQAGMTLNKFIRYWQITSLNTHEESFQVTDSAVFNLSQEIVVLNNSIEAELSDIALFTFNSETFQVHIRREGDSEYEEVSNDYVRFDVEEGTCISTMTWIGDQLSSAPVYLYEGDIIKVKYLTSLIRSNEERQIEEYIQMLPVADLRDETEQDYPLKNWNIRLIEEDDPLFDILVPTKHPFYEDIVFGHVRTEFPYGENIYNMEEYNGSTRPSTKPCDIDKEFLDDCGSCLSSTCSVDIAVEDLSNDRILEAKDVLDEYLPFHAQLRSINFSGELIDFIQPPAEEIVFLVTIKGNELLFAGNANPFFNRFMEGGLDEWRIEKDELSTKSTVVSAETGQASSAHIALVTPLINLKSVGIRQNNHFIEVLSPSANAGTYTVDQIKGSLSQVIGSVAEPVDESEFTFNVTNINYSNSFSNITERNQHQLTDSSLDVIDNVNLDFSSVQNGWKIVIDSKEYEIDKVEENTIYFYTNNEVASNGVKDGLYSVKDSSDNTIFSSFSGVTTTFRRALVELNDVSIVASDIIQAGDVLNYDGTDYEIVDIEDESNLVINEYEDGDVIGADIEVRRMILKNGTGHFGYRGLNLTTSSNHESSLGVVNGSNPPAIAVDDSLFKENFLIEIDGDFFKIKKWDGTNLELDGPEQSWPVSSSESVTFNILKFEKENVTIQFAAFDHLDRDGQDPIIGEIEVDGSIAISALSTPQPTTGWKSTVAQEEEVDFQIETRDQQGE